MKNAVQNILCSSRKKESPLLNSKLFGFTQQFLQQHNNKNEFLRSFK